MSINERARARIELDGQQAGKIIGVDGLPYLPVLAMPGITAQTAGSIAETNLKLARKAVSDCNCKPEVPSPEELEACVSNFRRFRIPDSGFKYET